MTQPYRLDAAGLESLKTADGLAAEVIRKNAADVDLKARFPRENIDALRKAGLLGLVSSGGGMRTAVAIVERIARECPSTAMIWIMHNCGTAVVEAHGSAEMKKAIAQDGKLTTLAFSESGSRSHFWMPVEHRREDAEGRHAERRESSSSRRRGSATSTSGRASRPRPRGSRVRSGGSGGAPGLSIPQKFEGLGLRGNGSAPIAAKDVVIPEANRLGEDGKGFDVMMGVVMPWFSIQNCAVSIGLMEGRSRGRSGT